MNSVGGSHTTIQKMLGSKQDSVTDNSVVQNLLDTVQEFATDNPHSESNYKLPIVSKIITP